MSLKSTIDAFQTWRDAGESIVMVTVIRTEGSTYSKAGHRILIAGNGDYQGLVSGGCLEGDLAEHARAVIATGQAQTVLYDLRDEADDIWGMGIGCNGMIEVLLQRLDADTGYEPFATIARCASDGRPLICSIVTASNDSAIPVGATVVDWRDDYALWQLPSACTGKDDRKALRDGRETRISTADGLSVLHAPLQPIPNLLIIGAGPDAVPLVRMANELGWRVTLADHRDAYINLDAFDAAERRCHVMPGSFNAVGDPNAFTAVIVMSHHLDTDRAWLNAIAPTDIRYVGLLGPVARRERLVGEIDDASALAGRLHGPVGLAIGADDAESIALSILAEMQAFLAEANPEAQR
jgi:xanthine/CO dehydrogenase XdhC/CoxF family maturation factor